MTFPLIGLIAACSVSSPPADAGSLVLTPKVHRNWSFELPAETFLPVSGSLPLPGGAGTYATELDGKNLRVDTDGDGATDVRVEGESGLVVLRGEAADGTPLTHAWRLRGGDEGWTYASASTRSTTFGKTKLQLIDQDGDGRYDGYGTDAMVVGRGDVACFLSRVVNVGGELYSISVSPDGARIDYAPYEGPAGSLDLATELDTDGKLLALVVRSADGQHSFDLARARAGMRVPTGSYALHSGRIGLGEATVEVRPGRARPLEVGPDAELAPVWGGPVEAEFLYHRAGPELAISPDEVRYYGSLGEEYTGWAPRGSSPEFRVSERRLGTELTKAVFPGSCCGHGFVPVAMSVPADADISITMTVDSWAFGEIAGFPVGQGVSSPEARE